jgi:NAD(P)-dependent dehydrogenase (short-subunit alcohol dehydrogenase family)
MATPTRTAVVTGGGAGMGEATCIRLAKAGTSVGIIDINGEAAENVARQINDNGGTAVAMTADVTDRGQVECAIGEVRNALGTIGILVNNAGVEDFTPFENIESANWDRIIEVNLKGTYNVTQVVLPDMIAQQWGRIINFSSIAAQSGGSGMVHYSAAKGGIISMTRSLAIELGAKGITVNAVAPGLIDTPMSRRAIDGGIFPIPVEEMVKSYPIPRMGRPEEAAAVIAFFASEEASYITAQLLGINGGTAV